MGSSGGYIAGSRKLVDYLKHTSPGFIFASGASPACVAAANAALQILKEEPEHIATLQANSQLFLQLAKQGNLNTGTSSETPIIPIIVGNSFDVLTVSERLIEQGFRAQTVVHPIVEESNARLCFYITALHSDSQIRSAVVAVHEQLDALG